jgi:hypothetical protein
MIFAQAEGFWKPPNVYDIVGLAGFVVGIGSIWLAWWLAKRDIRNRIDEAADRASRAARDEVRRVIRAIVQTGLTDLIRSLELARVACGGRQWVRGLDLCLLAAGQLARFRGQAALERATSAELAGVTARVEAVVEALRRQPRVGAGSLPADAAHGLDEAIAVLHEIDGRAAGIQPEVGDGQVPA